VGERSKCKIVRARIVGARIVGALARSSRFPPCRRWTLGSSRSFPLLRSRETHLLQLQRDPGVAVEQLVALVLELLDALVRADDVLAVDAVRGRVLLELLEAVQQRRRHLDDLLDLADVGGELAHLAVQLPPHRVAPLLLLFGRREVAVERGRRAERRGLRRSLRRGGFSAEIRRALGSSAPTCCCCCCCCCWLPGVALRKVGSKDTPPWASSRFRSGVDPSSLRVASSSRATSWSLTIMDDFSSMPECGLYWGCGWWW
jgi:hypothetical protein